MSQIPNDLHYTAEHEWVKQTSDTLVKVGITDFAQGALGDIVYVQLPKIGESVQAGKVLGEVESTKSVSEIYSPLTGKISAINDALNSSPETLNSSPYEDGWIVEIEITDPQELSNLLDAAAYATLTY
jgi:glycine cleavage system H protein